MKKASSGGRDVRRFDRRDALLPVVVHASGNRVEAGLTLEASDLSEGGIFVRSDLLFEVGEDLRLEIPLGSGQVLNATGRVARVTRGGTSRTPAGMGIEFTHMAAQDRRALVETLRQLVRPAARKSA